jgi:hypothetical protein
MSEDESQQPPTPPEPPAQPPEPSESPFEPFETEWGQKGLDKPGETRDE